MINAARTNQAQKWRIFLQPQRHKEARRRVGSALQRWQEACDAWLSVKIDAHNQSDIDTVRQAKALKRNIDQAAAELKQALQLANA